MKRLALASLVLFLAMMACSPFAAPISAADSQATSKALIDTQVALTMAAKPTREPTRTSVPTATLLIPPSDTSTSVPSETSTATVTADGTMSETPTLTVTTEGPTATPSATVSATATFSGTVTATFTFTPGVLTYGTIPPEVPYGYVTLKNLTNDMVYIAFRCAMTNGLTSLLEYPVYSVVKEKLPTGSCQWTAFVKNQEFKGELRVKKFEEYTLTFKPNKVIVTRP